MIQGIDISSLFSRASFSRDRSVGYRISADAQVASSSNLPSFVCSVGLGLCSGGVPPEWGDPPGSCGSLVLLFVFPGRSSYLFCSVFAYSSACGSKPSAMRRRELLFGIFPVR